MRFKSFSQYLTEAPIAPDAPPPNKVSSHSNVNQPESVNSVDMNRVFSRLLETRPADLRRVVRKGLESGDFDDDLDLKKEVENFYQSLSTGKTKNISQKDQEYVSRPTSDSPDASDSGGAST